MLPLNEMKVWGEWWAHYNVNTNACTSSSLYFLQKTATLSALFGYDGIRMNSANGCIFSLFGRVEDQLLLRKSLFAGNIEGLLA